MQIGSINVTGQYQVSSSTVQPEADLSTDTNEQAKSQVLQSDAVSISAEGQELLNSEQISDTVETDDGSATDGNGSGTLPPDQQATTSSTEIPGNGSGTLPPDQKPD